MSRLRPGAISEAMERLRDAALREMESPERGTRPAEPTFDLEHEPASPPPFNPDYPKDVPQYPGSDNPHVGNGQGPPI